MSKQGRMRMLDLERGIYYHRLRPLTLPPPHAEEAAVFQIWKWTPLLTEGGEVKWTPLLSSESCQKGGLGEGHAA